jgi:Family of unknown function (DUF6345)
MIGPDARIALTIWLVALASCAQPSEPDQLPVYRVSPAPIDVAAVEELGAALEIGGDLELTSADDRFRLGRGGKVVEIYATSGGVWAADEARLWNPGLKPELPDEEEARRIAGEFLRSQLARLFPPDNPASLRFAKVAGTRLARLDARTGTREDRQLDVQVNYLAMLSVAAQDGSVREFPVVGGGGDFNVVLGDRGSIIGYSGVWRPIAGIAFESPVIPKARADEQFRELTSGLEVTAFAAEIAYYSVPSWVEQSLLYPVYVYRAFAEVQGESVPLRIILLPATEFGTKPQPQEILPVRTQRDLPLRRPRPGEGEGPREAGASWIGLSGGLPGSEANAQGFIEALQQDGWSINFKWGDWNAWESDWRWNDDTWVDAADFVFYAGHGGMAGWLLRDPDDATLSFAEVGAAPENPGDLWGQDLEWLVIAAGGPLQDEALSSGGGNVFDRWVGAFDRLHLLLGYGAGTYDNADEGERLATAATDGKPLIDAWFRAAREIQPGTNGYLAPYGPTVYVGAIYVEKSQARSPADDHLHRRGPVAPDPVDPDAYVAMWSPT